MFFSSNRTQADRRKRTCDTLVAALVGGSLVRAVGGRTHQIEHRRWRARTLA
jgi:hypothetical protein